MRCHLRSYYLRAIPWGRNCHRAPSRARWLPCYLHGDADKIARFLTSGYTLTNSKGEISTVADDIKDAKTGKVHYDVFENYEMKARVYANQSAIVTGKTKIKGTAEGKPVDIVVQFTDTYVKQNGQLRLAAGYISRLKD